MHTVRQLLVRSTIVTGVMGVQFAGASSLSEQSITAMQSADPGWIVLAQGADVQGKPDAAPQKPPADAPARKGRAAPASTAQETGRLLHQRRKMTSPLLGGPRLRP